MTEKKAWNRPVVHSTNRGSSNCLLLSNRQRQSPRRYENHVRKETYITHLTAPERVQSMLTGLHGIDIITPGTSTVDHVQDNNITVNLLDFGPS